MPGLRRRELEFSDCRRCRSHRTFFSPLVQGPQSGPWTVEKTFMHGEAMPRPDPSLTDPEADLEEPVHLLLTAASRVAQVPQDATP